MTEVKQKARALIAEIRAERGTPAPDYLIARAALIRAIEQHEHFKREVSDAVEAYLGHNRPWPDNSLRRFIITKPVNPLDEALKELGWCAPEKASDLLRAALAARGLTITETKEKN